MSFLRLSELQGLLLSGYASRPHASYVLLRFGDPSGARRWIGERQSALIFGGERGDAAGLNLAFTADGLVVLGADRALVEATFSPAFCDGMASPYRSRVLGDTGANAPEGWLWGGPKTGAVHALLALYGAGEAGAFAGFVKREVDAATTRGLRVAHRIDASPPGALPDRSEHFGFADGISNPVFSGDPRANRLSPEERALQLVATGEFVLGWDNAYGVTPPVPRVRDAIETPFGRNGSYLVLRQLRQHVARFWQWCDSAAAGQGCDAELLAAKMVGRWRDGSPLALCPASPNTALRSANEFRYGEVDRRGDGCPLGAHVRRTNPRDSLSPDRADALRDANTHRILRRGRPYGLPPADPRVDDGAERGLVFACLNANPERQFEFVQQTWANNETFAKLRGERDPIIGTQPDGGGAFSIPGAPLRTRLTGIPEFVNTVGGAYFFLPSRSGLAQLAELG